MNKIDREFLSYHEANPQIFEKIIDHAYQLKMAGRKHYGMKAVIERVRWDYAIKADYDEKGFKINNNFTSRYARLAVKKNPDLTGFFQLRAIEPTSMFAEEEQHSLF